MLALNNKKVTINGKNIILADSPESRLKYRNKTEIDNLSRWGINSATCTLYGGDVKDIHPWMYAGSDGFGNPASGFDEPKLTQWRSYVEYMVSKGIVPVLLMSEKENHFKLSINDYKSYVDRMVVLFYDLPVIWQHEEWPTGRDTDLRNRLGYLKSVKPANHLLGIHNDTNQDNFSSHPDIIEVVGLQQHMNDAFPRTEFAYNRGFASYLSELVGGVNTGNIRQWCNIGKPLTSGAGAYIVGYDTGIVTSDETYKPIYDAMVQELGGSVTPSKPIVRIHYNSAKVIIS